MKKKIYVGCSLTHASEEFRKSIDDLKTELRKSYEVLDFIGLTAGNDRDVYEWDTNCVRTCDLFLADCTHPGTGLGFELGLAVEIGKPVLAVAHKDAKVTRLVRGITASNYTFKRYENAAEVEGYVEELLPRE